MKKKNITKPQIKQHKGTWYVTGWGRTIPTESFQSAQILVKYCYEDFKNNPHGTLIARRKLQSLLALGIHLFDLASDETPTSILIAALDEETLIHPITQNRIDELWKLHFSDPFTPPAYGPHVYWPLPMEWDNIEDPDETHSDHHEKRPKVWIERICTDGLTKLLATACGVTQNAVRKWATRGVPPQHLLHAYRVYVKAYELPVRQVA